MLRVFQRVAYQYFLLGVGFRLSALWLLFPFFLVLEYLVHPPFCPVTCRVVGGGFLEGFLVGDKVG